MALTDEEKKLVIEQIRADLEREHAAREHSLEHRSRDERAKAKAKDEKTREQEIAEIKREVQDAYYKEKGYQLYTDSSGRERWLSPSEWEWHRRHPRRKKRHRKYEIIEAPHFKVILAYVAIGIIAIIAGVIMSR